MLQSGIQVPFLRHMLRHVGAQPANTVSGLALLRHCLAPLVVVSAAGDGGAVADGTVGDAAREWQRQYVVSGLTAVMDEVNVHMHKHRGLHFSFSFSESILCVLNVDMYTVS
jgi:hypothetical protein